MRTLFIVLGLLALTSPAFGQSPCEGNEPYWYQNNVSPPPFGFLWALPGSLAITAMSLNARLEASKPKGDVIETRPGCLPLFIIGGMARPKRDW